MIDVNDLQAMLRAELLARAEEGCDVSAVVEQIELLEETRSTSANVVGLLDALSELEPEPDFAYAEPTAFEAIVDARPADRPGPYRVPGDLSDKILGAWLGRSAGCLLGKPVESLSRADIVTYLKSAGEYPLARYFPLLEPNPLERPLHRTADESTRGNIECMPRDDDIDYMLIALHILETYGRDYTASDVGKEWLLLLPFHQVFTAERAAYKNLVNGIHPPLTATTRNPYREWIGAQIRADVFGYVCPGDPEAAAALSYQDAALSHVKNGIYGELFAAAMVAAAFGVDEPEAALRAGMAQIPERSRLFEALTNTIAWSKEHDDWRDALALVMGHYGEYHWVHTINNACVVALGLMYGRGDFGRSISIAVECGMDTDCNGATVGSVLGAMHGAERLPGEWIDPLQDRVRSMVAGFDNSRISDLAERTLRLATPAADQPQA